MSWRMDTGDEGRSAKALAKQKRQHSDEAVKFVARCEQLAGDSCGSCFGYICYRLPPALDVGRGTGHCPADPRRRGFMRAHV